MNITRLMAMTRLTCGDLTLEGVTPAETEQLASTASGVIHSQNYMPFGTPWSAGSPKQRRDRLWRWYDAQLRESNPDRWTFIFRVRSAGDIIGSTNLYADGFANSRTVSTGSWLLQHAHGQGTGTAMRRMLLSLAFTHLGAERATSEAWEDNWSSRRVNEKCGYLQVGQYERPRSDRVAIMLQYELTRSRWTARAADDMETTVVIDPRLPIALL